MHLLEKIRGGLIVSCQAPEDSPLRSPIFMAAMAKAAERGGAVGIRANGPEDIRAIKQVCTVPVIGIYKRREPNFEVYITPDFQSAEAVIQAGADIVALDGTQRRRPGNLDLKTLIATIKSKFNVLIMADIATVEEALTAEAYGADLVATTLSGYTKETAYRRDLGPDLELVHALCKKVRVPVIAEGRIWTPEQACEALRLGAWAVVVGTAITNPEAITARFVRALKGGQPWPIC